MKWHSPVSAVPFFLGKTDLPQDDRSAGSHPRREAEFMDDEPLFEERQNDCRHQVAWRSLLAPSSDHKQQRQTGDEDDD
jgi:hypothetical protein